ncbi:MAG: hypothetical protein ACRDKT_10030, partial [Actinomycetota bacterium]
IEGSAVVLENLADTNSDIQALVANLDHLFVSLANRSSQIALLNERFALVAEALAADQANLEGTLENLSFLSDETATLISDSGDDLGRSLGRLERVLDTVLEHEASLTKGIKWANVVAQALGETTSSGRGVYAYSGRQAPPGTARAAYNYRLDSRDTVGCERFRIVGGSILSVRPDASIEDIADTVLNFFPEVYVDDLEFLVEELVPFCTDYQGPVLDEESAKIVRRIAARVGEKRFYKMLARWLLEGYETGGRP